MRLWSLHPKLLDPKGIVALWREGLLAKAVLAGETRGYTSHPQLVRFRQHEAPQDAINAYLWVVYQEAVRRGYRFDANKIHEATATLIPLTAGQLEFERIHLIAKLRLRSLSYCEMLQQQQHIDVHPLFEVVPGPPEPWEKGAASQLVGRV